MTYTFDILAVCFSTAALGFSIYTYNRQKKKQNFLGTRDFNLSWQSYNQVVSNDKDFQEFEQSLHPHGELTRKDVKRMYFYFMRFNTIYSAFRENGEFNSALATSALHTEANVSFKDRHFVRRHVFSRGYDKDFSRKFEAMWQKIKDDQAFLTMYGDEESRNYTSDIDANTRPADWTEQIQ